MNWTSKYSSVVNVDEEGICRVWPTVSLWTFRIRWNAAALTTPISPIVVAASLKATTGIQGYPVFLNPDYNICGGFSKSPCWLWSYDLVNFRSPNPRKVTIVLGGGGREYSLHSSQSSKFTSMRQTKLWILLRWSNILLEFRILSSCVA